MRDTQAARSGAVAVGTVRPQARQTRGDTTVVGVAKVDHTRPARHASRSALCFSSLYRGGYLVYSGVPRTRAHSPNLESSFSHLANLTLRYCIAQIDTPPSI